MDSAEQRGIIKAMGDKSNKQNTAFEMTNTAKYVRAINRYEIEVVFKNGVTKIYDTRPLRKKYPQIEKEFGKDINLFFNVHLDPCGWAVEWNDYVDVAIEDVWDNGKTVHTEFDNLLSMKDATDLWGLNESTLRKAIATGKLVEGVDARKFGKQWVLIKAAVEREYGKLEDKK